MNSVNAPAAFAVRGWPQGARAEDAFQGEAIAVKAGSPLRLDLSAYGVVAIRVTIGSSERGMK